jgi:hypothetical protein
MKTGGAVIELVETTNSNWQNSRITIPIIKEELTYYSVPF